MNLPTAEGLARVRRTRPLANLSRDFGRATPTDCVSPPPGHRDWLCVAPGFGACVVAAPSAFAARQLALAELGCEVADLSVEGVW